MKQQPKAQPVPPPNAPALDRPFSVQDAQTIEQILAGTTVQGLKGADELAALIRRFRGFVSAVIASGAKRKGKRK